LLTPPPAPPSLAASPDIGDAPTALGAVAGQHPTPKVLGAVKDATPPDIGDALGTAAGQYHAPKALKLPTDASPPDRGCFHLDFKSEDIENTNDARLVPTSPAQTVNQSNSQQNA
jgi:hypothetical protein